MVALWQTLRTRHHCGRGLLVLVLTLLFLSLLACKMCIRDSISAKIANDIFADLMENGAMPEAYVKEKGLVQISDSSALEAAVDKVLADNPAEVEAFRGGKTKLISFFVGQVMRATRGKANPALVNELLAKKLAG